jgi:cell division protein FtsB
MTRNVPLRWSLRDRLAQAGLVASLLGLGALALAGPSGLLAWAERKAVLDKREARIAALEEERAELRNRVELLDRDSADPDMVTELLRRDLNVAHPDDYVIELRPPQPER